MHCHAVMNPHIIYHLIVILLLLAFLSGAGRPRCSGRGTGGGRDD